jgi:cytochrome c oxidase subunit 3
MSNFSRETKKLYESYPPHFYHLVEPSPWPILTAFAAFTMFSAAGMYLHSIKMGGYLGLFGLFLVVTMLSFWWRDVIREGTYQGHHTKVVQTGIRLGMILFILSEVMFFFSFFWGFFTSSIAPTHQIGSIWPPIGIEVLSAFEVPLLNTVILLLSGATITWAHYAILSEERKEAIISLALTIALGLIFTALQVFEYLDCTFQINDGIYGTSFFMATGFHGFHVIVGTLMIGVCLYRQINHHFTWDHHVGFEAAAWYWHFVDVVWLFLFINVYWWSNK